MLRRASIYFSTLRINIRIAPLILAFGGLSSLVPCRAIIQNNLPVPTRSSAINTNSTMIFRTQSGACSATLVGPRVILTAARCLVNQSRLAVTTNYGPYSLECRVHPDFERHNTADFALCILDKELPGNPAMLNQDIKILAKGDPIYIVGYGCLKEAGVDAQYGQLTSGSAWAIQLPDVSRGQYNIVTIGDALCHGDSGGGAYIYNRDHKPILIGVNSESDLSAKSDIAATTTAAFLNWVKDWVTRSGDPIICGLVANAACDSPKEISDNKKISDAELLEVFRSDLPFLGLPPRSEAVDPDVFVRRKRQLVARKGQSIDRVVAEACGVRQPDAFFDQYRILNLNPGIKLTSTLDHDEEITIPYCATTRSRILIRTVNEEDSFDLWKKYRIKRPNWVDYTRAKGVINQEGLRSQYFMDVFKELNPFERNIERPARGSVVAVPIAPLSDNETTPAVIPDPQGPQVDGGVFSLDSDSLACSQTTTKSNYPYDILTLLDTLRANKQNAIAVRANNAPPTVRVLLADTGVRGASNSGILTQDLFSLPEQFGEIAKKIRPSFDVPESESEHGTEVATVLLGGPIFVRMQTAEHARIKLTVKRIFEKLAGQVSSSTIQSWENSIQNAVSDVQIVNLSISSHNKQEPLKFINKEDGPLYVVAAGNSYASLDIEHIFPARYGGLHSVNNITVAAVIVRDDGKLAWARFSNRSSNYVDIGAPGCNVPVLSYDQHTSTWIQKRASGTSFAAPLVSFAAAMIKSEIWEDTVNASDTKRRLLASADLHPELQNEIGDGRTLNLVKALTLYQDLVELNDGNGTIITGDASFVNLDGALSPNGERVKQARISGFCDGNRDQMTSFEVQDIYKIRPNFQVEGKKGPSTIVYYKGNSKDVFQRSECDFVEDLRIELRVGGDKLVKSLDEILDFVPRYRKFWTG